MKNVEGRCLPLLAALFILAAAMLSGCASKDMLPKEIREYGALRVMFFDAEERSGDNAALAHEVAQEIAQAFNVELEEVAQTKEITPQEAIDNGLADLVIGGIADDQTKWRGYSTSIYYNQGFLFAATRQGDYRNIFPVFEDSQIGCAEKLSDRMKQQSRKVLGGAEPFANSQQAAAALLAESIEGYFCYEKEAGELSEYEGIQVQDVVGVESDKYVAVLSPQCEPMIETANEAIVRLLAGMDIDEKTAA